MLELDGFSVTKRFEYELPAPFGPDFGPAKLWIVAKLAGSPKYEADLRELLVRAQVTDKKREEKDIDDLDLAAERQNDSEVSARGFFENQYKHCIVEWGSDIQSNGRDLRATEVSYVDLATHGNAELRKLFDKITADLSTFENWGAD